MINRKRSYAYIILGLLFAGVATYAYFASRPDPEPQPVDQVDVAQQPLNTEGDSSSTAVTYPVSIYFSKHPQSDDDPAATFPIARISPDSGVGKFTIAELLKGPTANEDANGYFSTVNLRGDTSTCSGKDFELSIKDSVATLRFCKPFDHLGSVSDGQAESAITASLLQFSSIQKVVILNSGGDCEFNLSGLNLCKE